MLTAYEAKKLGTKQKKEYDEALFKETVTKINNEIRNNLCNFRYRIQVPFIIQTKIMEYYEELGYVVRKDYGDLEIRWDND